MIDPAPIASAFERIANKLEAQPEKGHARATSRVRIDRGLTCRIEEGDWRLVADMPAKAGGNGEGPTPGVLGRAALGSCLAMGYVMEASRMGIPVSSVEVEVVTDFDNGALFGVSDQPPGYLDVRCNVVIHSSAPEEELRRVVDEAGRRSPYLDVFSRAQSVRTSLRVVEPE